MSEHHIQAEWNTGIHIGCFEHPQVLGLVIPGNHPVRANWIGRHLLLQGDAGSNPVWVL